MQMHINRRAVDADALAELRTEIAALSDRVAALERAANPTAASQRGTPHEAAEGEASPEVVAIITAVLAAHLGVKPHIRQISLVRGGAWAQQGRVTIQASHALSVQRD